MIKIYSTLSTLVHCMAMQEVFCLWYPTKQHNCLWSLGFWKCQMCMCSLGISLFGIQSVLYFLSLSQLTVIYIDLKFIATKCYYSLLLILKKIIQISTIDQISILYFLGPTTTSKILSCAVLVIY